MFRKREKWYVYLEPAEISIVIKSLNNLRNDFLMHGLDTDDVDGLLLKVMKASRKKI